MIRNATDDTIQHQLTYLICITCCVFPVDEVVDTHQESSSICQHKGSIIYHVFSIVRTKALKHRSIQDLAKLIMSADCNTFHMLICLTQALWDITACMTIVTLEWDCTQKKLKSERTERGGTKHTCIISGT